MEKKLIIKDVKYGFLEEIYLIEVFKGLCITAGHFFANFFAVIAKTIGLRKDRGGVVTIYYPEEKRFMHPNLRARHRLMQREDGTPKCVACMMCETVCPCNCIHIEAAEGMDDRVEKYPKRFVIEILRCCFCGLCAEACPEDAIRMDSGIVEFALYDRTSPENFYNKEFLLNSAPLISGHPVRHGWTDAFKYPGETVEVNRDPAKKPKIHFPGLKKQPAA